MARCFNPAAGTEVYESDLPAIGSVVEFETDYEKKYATVSGHGYVVTTTGQRPMLLVSLNMPLYSNMEDLYVSLVVLHPNNVTRVIHQELSHNA